MLQICVVDVLHIKHIQEEEKKKEKEEKAKQKKEEAKMKEPETAEEDLALKEMTDATAREELRKAKEHDKEKLCNISRALAVLASASV
jgi:LETM1 and EF-hand domain-containing protein 1, mitochondrial